MVQTDTLTQKTFLIFLKLPVNHVGLSREKQQPTNAYMFISSIYNSMEIPGVDSIHTTNEGCVQSRQHQRAVLAGKTDSNSVDKLRWRSQILMNTKRNRTRKSELYFSLFSTVLSGSRVSSSLHQCSVDTKLMVDPFFLSVFLFLFKSL